MNNKPTETDSNKVVIVIEKLDQSAVLELLRLNVSVKLPEQELIETYENIISLNSGITLTGNSLNDVIEVTGFHISHYPLSEVGLSTALEDISNALADFNQF